MTDMKNIKSNIAKLAVVFNCFNVTMGATATYPTPDEIKNVNDLLKKDTMNTVEAKEFEKCRNKLVDIKDLNDLKTQQNNKNKYDNTTDAEIKAIKEAKVVKKDDNGYFNHLLKWNWDKVFVEQNDGSSKKERVKGFTTQCTFVAVSVVGAGGYVYSTQQEKEDISSVA